MWERELELEPDQGAAMGDGSGSEQARVGVEMGGWASSEGQRRDK